MGRAVIRSGDNLIVGADAPVGTEVARVVGLIRADEAIGNLAGLELADGGSLPVSNANEFRFRYNTGLQRLEGSTNAAAYLPFAVGQGVVIVADSTALGTYPDAPLANGCPAWVASRLCSYILDKNDTTTPTDGRRVVASSDGKRWFRVMAPNPAWLGKAIWGIDAVAGNDDNDGGIVGGVWHPLATWDELRCRMAQGVVSVAQSVYLQTDLVEDVIIDWSHDDQLVGSCSTTIIGTRSDEYSGTCGAGTTAYDPATSSLGRIEDAAVPTGAWSTSGLVGHHFRMTTGTHIGYVGVIATELAASPTKCYYLPLVNVTTWTTGVAPLAGEQYTVYDLTTVTGKLEIQNPAAYVATLDVAFENLGVTEPVIENAGGVLVAYVSRFVGDHSTDDGGTTVAIGNRFAHTVGAFSLVAGRFDSTGNWFDGHGVDASDGSDFVVNGASIFSSLAAAACPVGLRGASTCTFVTWASWLPTGTIAPALDLQEMSFASLTTGYPCGKLVGALSSISVKTGAELFYAAGYAPTVTGAATDVAIGATTYTYAQLPVGKYPHGVVYQTE